MAQQKVKDVISVVQFELGFPLSRGKIKAAGYDVTDYLIDLSNQLWRCEDIDTHYGRAVLKILDELRQKPNP